MSEADNSQFAIDLQYVDKVYRGKIHALRGIEMHVRSGEIFGLLGPNGAGKSTLVKILMTVVRPNSVKGTLLGQPVGRKSALARVGYLPEHHRMPRYLTGRQVLEYYGALARVPRAQRKKRAGELLEVVSMADWADRRVGAYSKGMQQRIGLAQTLMNDPELVVLDEPTDGVDPVGRRDIRDIMLRLKEEGRTIFINSHLLGELEMVCERVAILVEGTVRMQGTIDGLTAESQRLEIVIDAAAPPWVEGMDTLRAESIDGGRTKLVMLGSDPGPAQPIIDRLRGDGVTIRTVLPVRESLEDLFMRAVSDNGEEADA